MPRSSRLLRREQYTAALAEGVCGARRYFSLFVRPNGLTHARLGVIAGKREAPRAIDRNRAKRLVREGFRKLRKRLSGVDVVLRLRRCPPHGSNALLAAEVAKLLEGLLLKQGRN